MILRPAALLAAIVTLTFVGSVFAADPVNIEIMSVDEEPGRMTLSVSAVDENGKPFPGLDPSSFNAWINDTALIVKELHTETDRQPASVLLLVDASGSMGGEPIEQAKIAINEFIGVLEPNDEVAVMTFSSGVNLVQDFTSDRAALDTAITNITLTNDTALYDGVTAAAARMADLPASRKIIVLLSDGLANINQGARDASIQSARESGVSIIAVSLGANTDRQYLDELTSASGGNLIEAATPAELRQAYTSLAFAIRSQYTLVMDVPRSIDRTVAGTLKVHVIHRADNAFAERALGPLEGAFPPPFSMSLAGINAGDKHNGSVDLTPAVQEGIEVVKVEYFLDDEVLHTSNGIDNYTLDASLLENGAHVLKVVATDVEGREGEVQVPFLVPVLVAPSSGSSLPLIPILALLLLLGVGFLAFKFGRKRWLEITTPTYSRVDTWASIRMATGGQKAEDWSDDDSAHPMSRPAASETPRDEAIQGRVVIMDEAAVRGGELETIREFDMKSLPLTFGSSPNADMRVDDAGGLIAAEEARIWVQRGRLVYHKLTTLSAMATEGVTAGWQFLNDGEEMRIGPYRIIFQKREVEAQADDAAPIPDRLPQEHGMALHRAFGLTETDRSPDLQDWDNGSEPAEPNQDVAAPLNLVTESGDAAVQEVDKPASSLDVNAGSAAFAAGAIAEAGTVLPEQDSAQPDGQSANWNIESPGESQWTPPLLEPKSADWLVEQSQPVEDAGQIVQSESWGSFVSSDGSTGPSPSSDEQPADEEEEPQQRAWGT